MAGVGWVFVVVAGLACAMAIVALAQDSPPRMGISPAELVVFGALALAAAVPDFLAAAVVRMMASVGLAVRDLARNSFGER